MEHDQVLTAELAMAMQIEAYQSGALPMWTVYNRPSDYPDQFVVRLGLIRKPEPAALHAVILGPTLDDVRSRIPFGLHRMDRDPNDEPCIVEVWF